MPRKSYKPEEIVAKLRQVDVLTSQGQSVAEGIRSIGFTIYVSRIGSYDKTYGSLGALIILLLWFYLTSYVILAGAELNAEVERRGTPDAPG